MLGNIGNDLSKTYDVAGKFAAAKAADQKNTNAGVGAAGDGGTKASAGVNGIEECQTCKTRRYQDGSNDPGVSFKTPTKLDPSQAATAVYSHEREHYVREADKAESEGREVLSNDIVLFSAVCTECGKTYVSGGETTTVTRKKSESASFAKDFFDKTVGVFLPKIMDVKA